MIVKVSEKGSIVIPAKVRAKYGIKPQSMVEFVDLGGEIVLIPVSDDPIGDSRGILKSDLTAKEILEEGRKLDKQKESINE